MACCQNCPDRRVGGLRHVHVSKIVASVFLRSCEVDGALLGMAAAQCARLGDGKPVALCPSGVGTL